MEKCRDRPLSFVGSHSRLDVGSVLWQAVSGRLGGGREVQGTRLACCCINIDIWSARISWISMLDKHYIRGGKGDLRQGRQKTVLKSRYHPPFDTVPASYRYLACCNKHQ